MGNDEDQDNTALYSQEMMKQLQAFIQLGNSNVHSLGESIGDSTLVTEDLESMDSSLLTRANVEAGQWDQMNAASTADAMHDVHSLAEAQANESKIASTVDPVETTLLDQQAEHKNQGRFPVTSKSKDALAVVKLDETHAHSPNSQTGAVEEAGELATKLQS